MLLLKQKWLAFVSVACLKFGYFLGQRLLQSIRDVTEVCTDG